MKIWFNDAEFAAADDGERDLYTYHPIAVEQTDDGYIALSMYSDELGEYGVWDLSFDEVMFIANFANDNIWVSR